MTTLDSSVKLSVIIPTRNRPQLLERALRSVAMQDMSGVEVCIIDNNVNPDLNAHADELVRLFAGQYSHIKWIYLHSAQLFASGARNDGIKATTGKYIVFLDDDDEMLEGSLHKRLAAMQANSGVALMYCAGYSLIYPYPFKMYRYYKYDPKRHTDKLLMMSCSNIMIDRAIFAQHDLVFDEHLSRMDDHDLCNRVIQLGLNVLSVPDPLVLIHMHQDTRMSSHKLISYDFRDIMVERWGSELEDEIFSYAEGVHLWRKCFGIQDLSYPQVKASLKNDFDREPSRSFKAKYLLASISPQLFLATYHLTVTLSQWFKNSRA